jgi:hypothetical protein
VDTSLKYVVLLPSLLIKDESKAMYQLPSKEFVKGKKSAPFPKKKLELVAKTSKGSKKKSAKTIKGSKKK